MKKHAPQEGFVQHDFAYGSDTELNTLIASFKSAHEAAHGQLLTMHERRSLGAGRVRITFRVRAGKASR
jgi:hypothetical protein